MQLLGAGGGDHRGDALGLLGGELAVEVRAGGELAGLGGTHALDAQHAVEEGAAQGRTAGEDEFGGVFPGVRTWTAETPDGDRD